MQDSIAKAEKWIVEVDENVTDKLLVTIYSALLYLDFFCADQTVLQAAATFLRSPLRGASLQFGTFCNDLSVEFDCFVQEPAEVYLSVTRPEEQSMAYRLCEQDRMSLAAALDEAISGLNKRTNMTNQ